MSEAMLTADVLVSVFEDKNGRLEDLDGVLLSFWSTSVVDVGLFACAQATYDSKQPTILIRFYCNF